jgi:hypothetical protein
MISTIKKVLYTKIKQILNYHKAMEEILMLEILKEVQTLLS